MTATIYDKERNYLGLQLCATATTTSAATTAIVTMTKTGATICAATSTAKTTCDYD